MIKKLARDFYAVNETDIKIEPFTTFGWKVHRHSVPAGSKMVMVAKQTMTPNQVPNRAMYTKGRAIVYHESGKTYDDRKPGMYTGDRSGILVGKTTIHSADDLEFWCFNYTVNRKALPDLDPVRLMAGEELEVQAGTNLFVMLGKAGEVEGPCDFRPEANTTLKADTNLYAFVIAKERV